MSIKMRVLMVLAVCGMFAGAASGGVVAATSYGLDETPFGSLEVDTPTSAELGLTANEFLSDEEIAATQEDGPAPEIVINAQGVWMRLLGSTEWINVTEHYGLSAADLSGLTSSEIAAKMKGFTTAAESAKQDEGFRNLPGFTAGRASSLGGGVDTSGKPYSRMIQLSALSVDDGSWLADKHNNSNHMSSLSAQSCPAMVSNGGTSKYQLGASGGGAPGSNAGGFSPLALLPAQPEEDNQDQVMPESPIVTDPTVPDETPILMASYVASAPKIVGLPTANEGTSMIPEPVTMSLLGVAVAGLLLRRKR